MIHVILDLHHEPEFDSIVVTHLDRYFYPTHMSTLLGLGNTRQTGPDFIRAVLVTDTPASFIYDVPTYYLPADLLSDPVPVDDIVCRKLTGQSLVELRAQSILTQSNHPVRGIKKAAKELAVQLGDIPGFGYRTSPPMQMGTLRYVEIDSPELLAELNSQFDTCPIYAVDVETNRLDPLSGVVCLTASFKPREAYYVPAELVSQVMSHIHWDRVTGHNLKYDIQALGVFPERVGNDTHIRASLAEVMPGHRGLKDMVKESFGFQMVEFGDLVPDGESIADADPDKRRFYACSDSDWSLRLELETRDSLPDRSKPIYEIQMHMIPIIAELEANGLEVDMAALKLLEASQEETMSTLIQEIYDIAGHSFNLDSPQQFSKVLYTELGLPRTRFKTSTDTDVVSLSLLDHPIARAVESYREVSKALRTYTKPLQEHRHPTDLRIHPNVNMARVASGRLSMDNPNMQNIPKTDTYRSVVRASPGNLLLKIDYDQLELRVLAGISGGSTMRRVFESGGDIHAHTASIIHGVPVADVTDSQRQDGKKGNFAIGYGAREKKLVEIGLAKDIVEAATIIRQLRLAYSDEMAYIDEEKLRIKREREVWTLSGRRRTFGDYVPLDELEREGFNHIIQGTGVEMVFIGMVNAMPIIRRFNAKLINQVHDEVVIEARASVINQLRDEIVPEMERTGFILPLTVTSKISPVWTV